MSRQVENQPVPFVAPCCQIGLDAPRRWLKLGFGDLRQAPIASLSLGLIMAAMVMFVTVMAWQFGSAWIMLSLLCGFVFAAPIACIGTYAISAQIERRQVVSFRRMLRACFKRYRGTSLVFTLVLLIVFLIWARASSMISIFLPSTGNYTLEEVGVYVITLSLVSVLFLSITFAASVFSLPIIMHRDVDAITAVVTSINAVLRNKLAMAYWGALIAIMLVVGVLSAGLGLIVILPAVSHAVWHGYIETIDASAFPRHQLGITASARSSQKLDSN